MSYVFVPPATSQRAHRLADQLSHTIEEFRRGNPQLTGAEVSAACRLAARRNGSSTRKQLSLAVAMAVALLIGLLAFYLVQR